MEFTNEQKHRIDVLYGEDFKGELTADDVKLIAEWEKYKIENDLKYQANKKEQDEITARKIEIAEDLAAIARKNLSESANRSRKRWERLRYGQEK